MSKTKVCVYGTLKEGHCNSSALRNSSLLGTVKLTGPFKMVDLQYYPALIPTDSDEKDRTITAEIWEVDEETLYSLDLIEGHPNYYKRTKIDTPYGKAWCYFLPLAYKDHPEVVTGDWQRGQAA